MNRLLRSLVIVIASYYLLMLGFAVTSWLLRGRLRRMTSTTEDPVPVLRFI